MRPLVTTARLTGAAYLALAVTGMAGYLVIRPALYVPGDPSATLDHLTERPGLAQLGGVVELLVVVSQALLDLVEGRCGGQLQEQVVHHGAADIADRLSSEAMDLTVGPEGLLQRVAQRLDLGPTPAAQVFFPMMSARAVMAGVS